MLDRTLGSSPEIGKTSYSNAVERKAGTFRSYGQMMMMMTQSPTRKMCAQRFSIGDAKSKQASATI